MPSINTRPAVGSSRPAMMLKIVLLPQPDGPIRLTNRPFGIDKVTGASATKAPPGVSNALLTRSISSFAIFSIEPEDMGALSVGDCRQSVGQLYSFDKNRA